MVPEREDIDERGGIELTSATERTAGGCSIGESVGAGVGSVVVSPARRRAAVGRVGVGRVAGGAMPMWLCPSHVAVS